MDIDWNYRLTDFSISPMKLRNVEVGIKTHPKSSLLKCVHLKTEVKLKGK